MKLAIFYHCVTHIDGKRLPAATAIIDSQMAALKDSGLLDAASNFFVGFNSDYATLPVTQIPDKATVVCNGSTCKTELRTLRILEKWLPGHGDDWAVLWLHSKGATRPLGFSHSDAWRECSMHHLVKNWRNCVQDLQRGFDSVGTHWMCGDETPPGQSIWAGNIFWATGKFLLTLPSVMERDRIKAFGLDDVGSRYEAEIHIGNGPKLPKIYDWCPGWNPSRPHVKIGAP